jgi:hypothetical protein
MPNVISSAIVNTPPPDLLADVLNKRNKVHHFDKETDEAMIPIFGHGVDGKPRNNKHLLPHRNWCSIREYVPGHTPLPTPNHSAYDFTPLGSPPGTASGEVGRKPSIFRRLSKSGSRGADAPPKDRSRPPLSGGGLLRSFSRRAGVASADEIGRPQSQQQQQQQQPPDARPGFLTRTLSGTSVKGRLGGLFRRQSSASRAKRDDGGINGVWGPDTDEEDQQQQRYYDDQYHHQRAQGHGQGGGVGMRGGLGVDPYQPQHHPHPHQHHQHPHYPPTSSSQEEGASEFQHGDEEYFSVRPAGEKPVMMSGGAGPLPQEHEEFVRKPFHRTPTALSAKQQKNAREYAVDLSGALEVTLNVEISQKDPGGSTVPYRLVVPRLWYEYDGEEGRGGRVVEEVMGGEKGFVDVGGEQQQQQQHHHQQMAGVGEGDDGVYGDEMGEEEVVKERPRGLKRLISLRRKKATGTY